MFGITRGGPGSLRSLRRTRPILPPSPLPPPAHLQSLAQPIALRHPGSRCDIDSHPDCRSFLTLIVAPHACPCQSERCRGGLHALRLVRAAVGVNGSLERLPRQPLGRLAVDPSPSGDVDGLRWITTLRAPTIRKLIKGGEVAQTMFDERDLVEMRSPELPRRAADRVPQADTGRATAAQKAGVAGLHGEGADADRDGPTRWASISSPPSPTSHS